MTEVHLPQLVESSVAGLTAEQVATAFNHAFEGYLVPMNFTAQSYERRMRGVDGVGIR